LFTGFDRKRVSLGHTGDAEVGMRIEVDLTGTGHWRPYRSFRVPAGKDVEHEFPRAFQAYWVRAVAESDCTATAWFTYE
jgi:hypothetical protein